LRLPLVQGSRAFGVIGLAVALASSSPRTMLAQNRAAYPDTQPIKPRVELFGQLVTDVIYDFEQNNPAWFDVVRPTKLPAFTDEFGRDGRMYYSVRPTRLGVRTAIPTKMGQVNGIFDFDMFGDAGRAGFSLSRAYVSLGKWGMGQYDSPFMDIDVFPNTLEYWGPSGMIFFRNVQVRYMPIQGASRVTVALERPGASGDRGDADGTDVLHHIDLADVVGRFPWPDLSAEGRLGRKWGYVELAGILRGIYWDDLLRRTNIDLDGSALGWGLSLSSNIKTSKTDVFKLQINYGEGIESYVSDAPFDIGAERHPENPFRPITGEALPVLAGTAFYDHSWNSRFTSSIGYSGVRITNSNGQSALAFHSGQYALANVLYTPDPSLLFGGELQWGHRKNAFDGFGSNDFRIQFTGRLNFAMPLVAKKENDNGK